MRRYKRLSTKGVKKLNREAEHLPPFSAVGKNAWTYTSTHAFMTLLTLFFAVAQQPNSGLFRPTVEISKSQTMTYTNTARTT